VPAAFTVPTGQAHWHVLLRARAIETGCFVFAPAQTAFAVHVQTSHQPCDRSGGMAHDRCGGGKDVSGGDTGAGEILTEGEDDLGLGTRRYQGAGRNGLPQVEPVSGIEKSVERCVYTDLSLLGP